MTRTPRFSWLNRIVGQKLPAASLELPEQAWNAAATEAGISLGGLTHRIADRFRLPILDPDEIDPTVADLIDPTFARGHFAIPVSQDTHTVRVATCDPVDPDLVDALAFRFGREVEVVLAPPSVILSRLDLLNEDADEADAEWDQLSHEHDDEGESDPTHDILASSPGMLDRMIVRGIRMNASDVHFLAMGTSAAVRFRVDGVLQMGPKIAWDDYAIVLGRAKAIGGMDPSIRLRAQDGRGRVHVDDTAYDLRFSTIPASHSESLVVRILPQSDALDIDHYGADADSLQRLREGFLERSSGIFTVTGPTGSGKTTLLYALLARLNSPDRQIHTVEDPVEVQLRGLAQVQINERAGLTFATSLRSILRQDPDVILVGETRDAETAGVVVQAAITGHLVATTLHTIDTATSLIRFRDLGVEPGQLVEALNGVFGAATSAEAVHRVP